MTADPHEPIKPTKPAKLAEPAEPAAPAEAQPFAAAAIDARPEADEHGQTRSPQLPEANTHPEAEAEAEPELKPEPESDEREQTHSERFRQAAIDAELETGEREPTRQEAQRGAMRRLARTTFGMCVVVLGLILMPLPGPGTLVVATGLAILARDVAWADRLLQKVRGRLPSDVDGKLPRSTIVTMVLLAAAGIAASIWFTVGDVNPIDVALFWRD
ncbi:PGPGW domain-containing protein [Candidatus Poriferisodalis sp.]|uniref:PGPGW domain-containing protein n=1 Tax=Candidatus Poriferisodalis sp. TaxID=3101277 RepID=UPI003B01C80F